MATNNDSEEIDKRIKDFFEDCIAPKDLAKSIRKLSYLIAFSAMSNVKTSDVQISNFSDHFYWLNQLAEVLDPYLDVE